MRYELTQVELEEGNMKFSKQVNRALLFTITAIFTVISSGCGADSLQDTQSQERDRQRQMASLLAKDYAAVVGSYVTASPVSATDTTQYYMIAQIKLVNTQKDGSLVPQPALSGTFRMFPADTMSPSIRKSSIATITKECAATSDTDPMKASKCGYLFAFSGGTYDSLSKVMALHIQGYGVAGADVQCTRTSETLMNCWWQPASGGADGFNFSITKSL